MNTAYGRLALVPTPPRHRRRYGAPPPTDPKYSTAKTLTPGITESLSSSYSLPYDLRAVAGGVAPWEAYVVDSGGASAVAEAAETVDPTLATVGIYEKGGVEQGYVINGAVVTSEEEKTGPNPLWVAAGIFGALLVGGVAFAAVRRRKSP